MCIEMQYLYCLFGLYWRLLTVGAMLGPTPSRGLPTSIGFDLGTSGARISVIQPDPSASKAKIYKEIYSSSLPWPENGHDDPVAWMNAVLELMDCACMAPDVRAESVASICISGTSASCLLVDSAHAAAVTRKPRMYNFDIAASTTDPIHRVRAVDRLLRAAPDRHTARSSTGSLAKLLLWNEEQKLASSECICHQADYIALQFLSSNKQVCDAGPANIRTVSSDWHNCLKLGYDVQQLKWPDWLITCLRDAGVEPRTVLPNTVVSPGQPLGTICSSMAARFGLPQDTVIVGGTTDSNAAFFAATGSRATVGTAVSSLGSTLAIKQLSRMYVEDATVGVYSHRFPSVFLSDDDEEAWLAGGASNVGCAVLRQLQFSTTELEQRSGDIDPSVESPLSYYPLTKRGERFPIADSNKEPVMEPVPDSRTAFLHGILQGISTVECNGYKSLAALGATPPQTIYTSGGGSRNEMWSRMRERRLSQVFEQPVAVTRAENVEASFGAAILAAAHLST
jgi:D-ribulokinase